MENKCYIAAAGAGKTTFIVEMAKWVIESNSKAHVAIITFTRRNQDGIKDCMRELTPQISKQIKVLGWYEFLLKYIIRPYKGSVIEDLYEHNVGLLWDDVGKTIKVNGKDIARYKDGDKKSKYLKNWKIHKNYVSEFAYECIHLNKNSCLARLSHIFSHIMIDECQDLAAFDLEVVGYLCKTDINIVAVGDPRQRTYITNTLRKHQKYAGKLDLFLKEKVNTKRKEYISIDENSLNVSHRCGATACDIASTINPEYPKTTPCACPKCVERRHAKQNGLDQVYWVREEDEEAFIIKFSPTALTHDKTKTVNKKIIERINMGESKGIGRLNCLIYPTANMLEFFKNQERFFESEMAKLYVALTRATHVVGILVPSNFKSLTFDLPYWHPVD